MDFFERLLNFFKNLFVDEEDNLKSSEKAIEVKSEESEEESQEIAIFEEEQKIDISERTISSRLYMIEQSITSFKELFPNEYTNFLERIHYLKADYEEAIANSQKTLTFEIDPDLSYQKRGEVLKLEHDIQDFIKKDVKYALIIKRLQRLILKLNILFNVSIWYGKEKAQENGLNQIERAKETETRIIEELKQIDAFANDIRIREEIVNLIAYIDFLIFRISIRYSDKSISDLLNNSLIVTEFIGFEYVPMFKAFISDEIYGMNEYIRQITEESYKNAIKCNRDSLINGISYSTEEDRILLSREFWEDVFDFESQIFNYLRDNGVLKENLSIKISSNINIHIDEKEVISLPKVNAILALTSTYYRTYDTRLLILNMMLKNISESITYKEIYLLFVLFGVLDMVTKYQNDISAQINKYAKKYPYDKSKIEKRKQQVMAMPNKTYVYLFDMDNYEESIVETMIRLNLDFMVENNKLFINSFYFNGLDNITKSLNPTTSTI